MVNQAIQMATKGILSCGTPAAKGVVVVCIVETPIVRRRKGAPGVQGEKKRKIISVFYNFDGELKEYRQIVNEDVKISLDQINIEIVDQKPVISFKVED